MSVSPNPPQLLVVAATTPAIEPSVAETVLPAVSAPMPLEAAAEVAAAAQQAVEIGSRLGTLEAKLDALVAAVGALQGMVDGGLAQTTRQLAEFETTLQGMMEEETEETPAAATPVQVESPATSPIPAQLPSRPGNKLRRFLLGG